MLPGSWMDQAHRMGTAKVLQDAVAIAALRNTQVQQQISVLTSLQFWNYRVTDDRWHDIFEGRNKLLNLDK